MHLWIRFHLRQIILKNLHQQIKRAKLLHLYLTCRCMKGEKTHIRSHTTIIFNLFWMCRAIIPRSLLAKHAHNVMWCPGSRHANSCSRCCSGASEVRQKHLPTHTQVLEQSHTAWLLTYSLKCTMEERSSDTSQQSVHNYSYCQVSTPASGLRGGNCWAVKATRFRYMWALGEIISVTLHVISALSAAL